MADGAVEALSLPAVYSALRRDRVADFPALRPHQRHAWHAFLAQLATIALERSGARPNPESAKEWEAVLRALTPEYAKDEPWCLIVEDPAQPAYMQCPTPEGLDDYRKRIETPDDLDLLVTSKNHDVKQTVALSGAPEDWLFALVDLQTMAGFLGAGNYGIARMNGGFSSRPCLGLAPAGVGVGAHLFHDIERMLSDRAELLERYPSYFRPQGGSALLWLDAWGGTQSLDLRSLDPYFIEVCRRVRLRNEDGIITALAASSRKSRVEARAAKGNLGDFWTPVDVKEGKALSVSASGFTYKRLTELLFEGTYSQPPAMKVDRNSGGHWTLVARGVAGGQGKTEGFHERTDITFSPRVARAFRRPEERDRLAELAKMQIDEVAAVTQALRFGIAMAASGGKAPAEIGRGDFAHAVPFVERLDAAADARFFAALDRRFSAKEEDVSSRRADFARYLISVARALLHEAIESVPCPSIRRHRARAKGYAEFERNLRRAGGVFGDQPEVFVTTEGTDDRSR